MKKLCIFIGIVLLFGTGQVAAQVAPINNFYRKHKFRKDMKNANVPGWLIRLGANIGAKHAEDEKDKEAIQLAKKIRKVKFLFNDEGNRVNPLQVKKLIRKLEKRCFEPLVIVREGTTRVNVMIREEGDIIKNLFMIFQDTDEFMMFSIKSRISIDDINMLIQMIGKEHDIPIAKIMQPKQP